MNIEKWRAKLDCNDKAYLLNDGNIKNIIEITVMGKHPDLPDCLWVKYNYTVTPDGSHEYFMGGESACYRNNLYPDAETAYDALINMHTQCVRDYLSGLNTLEDILKFPLSHQLSGEDADWAAREAYETAIKKFI